MGSKSNPQSKIDEVIGYHLSHPEWSAAMIAKFAGGTKDSVQKIINRHSPENFKPAYAVDIPPPLKLEGDFVVTADVHVPTTDKSMAEAVVVEGKKRGIKRLALVGDLFCQDMFSRYATLIETPGFKTEIDFAISLFEYWLSWYEEVYFCRGNHDDRIIEWNKGQIAMDHLGKLVSPEGKTGRIKTSMRNYMFLGDDWLLMHQCQYNKYPLHVACDYASKHRKNVVACHQHHCAMGVHEGFTVVDCGCLADPDKTTYHALTISKFPDWEPGFAMIQNGYAELYSKRGRFGVNTH